MGGNSAEIPLVLHPDAGTADLVEDRDAGGVVCLLARAERESAWQWLMSPSDYQRGFVSRRVRVISHPSRSAPPRPGRWVWTENDAGEDGEEEEDDEEEEEEDSSEEEREASGGTVSFDVLLPAFKLELPALADGTASRNGGVRDGGAEEEEVALAALIDEVRVRPSFCAVTRTPTGGVCQV